jgi:hypothetical protein
MFGLFAGRIAAVALHLPLKQPIAVWARRIVPASADGLGGHLYQLANLAPLSI